MSNKVTVMGHGLSEGTVEDDERLTVSLKTLAARLDASRDSVRRWLNDAGIRPIAMSNGAKGAIRYRWSEVQAWLQARAVVE